jgi:hypothetical protein
MKIELSKSKKYNGNYSLKSLLYLLLSFNLDCELYYLYDDGYYIQITYENYQLN